MSARLSALDMPVQVPGRVWGSSSEVHGIVAFRDDCASWAPRELSRFRAIFEEIASVVASLDEKAPVSVGPTTVCVCASPNTIVELRDACLRRCLRMQVETSVLQAALGVLNARLTEVEQGPSYGYIHRWHQFQASLLSTYYEGTFPVWEIGSILGSVSIDGTTLLHSRPPGTLREQAASLILKPNNGLHDMTKGLTVVVDAGLVLPEGQTWEAQLQTNPTLFVVIINLSSSSTAYDAVLKLDYYSGRADAYFDTGGMDAWASEQNNSPASQAGVFVAVINHTGFGATSGRFQGRLDLYKNGALLATSVGELPITVTTATVTLQGRGYISSNMDQLTRAYNDIGLIDRSLTYEEAIELSSSNPAYPLHTPSLPAPLN